MRRPLLWITDDPVADPKALLLGLIEAFPETGLWPLIEQTYDYAGSGYDPRPPSWAGESVFGRPDPDTLGTSADDAEAILAVLWSYGIDVDSLTEEGTEHGEWVRARYEPFGVEFPGLAPEGTDEIGIRECLERAPVPEARYLSGRLALVPVASPAEVPGHIGWSGATNYGRSPREYETVLSSWLERYRVAVIGIAGETLMFISCRPPTGEAVDRGVPSRGVPSRSVPSRSVLVTSATGYRRLLPAGDAGSVHLAVGYGGEPLGRGHGGPARLVVPGRRGPWWVKWVTEIELDDRPWWLQPPFPLT